MGLYGTAVSRSGIERCLVISFPSCNHAGDVWLIEWESKAKMWKQDGKVGADLWGAGRLLLEVAWD